MAIIIRNRQVVADNWQLHKLGEEAAVAEVPPTGDVIVPLAFWLGQRDALLARQGRIGVWLAPDQDPAQIASDLAHFSIVAVDFPQFTDGRGYSIARLLRERYGWKGELRAVGDVLRDQLFYLSRCGFDAYALRSDQDPYAALAAFNDFSDAYQASVERPVPLFRRRAAAGA